MAGIPRQLYEKRSLITVLQTYLTNAGWTDLQYNDRYTENQLETPQIAVRFVPSRIRTLQIGSIEGTDRVYIRRVQIDIYMESEERAGTILDDIMDFFDLIPVPITNPASESLGALICYDNDTIYAEELPPATTLPPLLAWRGIVRAEMEAHYPNG